MDRRSLLRLLLVIGFGLDAKSRATASAREGNERMSQQVIVIGAGLAGLAAARELQNHGFQVVVLEGRNRIGGRLWTSNKWPDIPVDLGASWIHGLVGNPLTELAKRAKAEIIETSYESNRLYDVDGQEIAEAKEQRLDRLRIQLESAIESAQDADQDVSLRRVIDRVAVRFGDNVETRQLVNFLASSTLEQEYAGSVERMSAQWFDSAEEFDGEDGLFPGGYHQITKFLADGLKIETNQVVQQIDWNQDQVRVTTNKGEFTADRMVLTLPLGVLKAEQVEFSPPLPNAYRSAIQKLEMGVLNKCYLRFPRVFWPQDVDWLECITVKHGEWVEWVSFARTIKAPVLLGFNAADRGREIEAWTDQQIVSSAMATLRHLFGPDIPAPIDYQVTRWASDPLALGSYSFNPVGADPKLRRQLAKPIADKLYLAGEATDHEYFGTAHGAYLSGLRAAAQIIDN
ncbi:MAG: FAD-dependent oxidoreductase [Planctomycetaceae bacterium]|nr:FAD-dependent oxidoreductase [Planctomycetaceae bacterium]